jgi:hypothetical protein
MTFTSVADAVELLDRSRLVHDPIVKPSKPEYCTVALVVLL